MGGVGWARCCSGKLTKHKHTATNGLETDKGDGRKKWPRQAASRLGINQCDKGGKGSNVAWSCMSWRGCYDRAVAVAAAALSPSHGTLHVPSNWPAPPGSGAAAGSSPPLLGLSGGDAAVPLAAGKCGAGTQAAGVSPPAAAGDTPCGPAAAVSAASCICAASSCCCSDCT